MAKNNRNRKSGDSRLRRGVAQIPLAQTQHTAPTDRVDLPEQLLDLLKRTLREPNPLGMITLVSSWLEEPAWAAEAADLPEDTDLVKFFDLLLNSPSRYTTAALALTNVLHPEGELAQRNNKELARRNHPLPIWLKHMDETEARGTFMVFDQGAPVADLVFGIHFADGTDATCVVYLDFRFDGAIRKVSLVAHSVDYVMEVLTDRLGDETINEPIDPAAARAILEHGLALVNTVEPVEFDDDDEPWLFLRPFFRWALTLLPDGGEIPSKPAWDSSEADANFYDGPDGDFDLAMAKLFVPVLLQAMGGASGVLVLDAEPLPDEEFPFDIVADDLQETVHAVVALCDDYANKHYDAEFRTVLRRIIKYLVTEGSAAWRRKASIQGIAAAIAWIDDPG